MAKYRISSIPQSLPKNQRGGLFKKKKENKNSIINYTPPSEETEVQGFEPQSALEYNFNPPFIPTTEQTPVYNIGPQNYGRERTPEEEANTFTQPINWTYGETVPAHDYTFKQAVQPIRNPWAENAYKYSLQKKMGIPYEGNKMEEVTAQMPEKFYPDYFAPVTETGQPLKCNDGKIAYKGQCITEEAYAIIRQREIDDEEFQYQKSEEARKIDFVKDIYAIRKDNQEQSDRLYDRNVNNYFDTFEKSKKPDKIEPFESTYTDDLKRMVPVVDSNGQQVIDEKTGEPLQQTLEENLKKNFLLHKTENGYTELYPLTIVTDRIWNNGFQAQQFKNYWGLDPKQVEAQVGDLMKMSKAQYDATVKQKILDKSLKEGISPDEAAETFSTKLGYASAFKKDHAPAVQKQIDQAFETYIEDSLKGLQKDLGVKVDDKGFAYYDSKKKPIKQTIDFDFFDDIYNDKFDDSGVLISRDVDPFGKYAEKWIISAKTPAEQAARRRKVLAVYTKDYSKIGNDAYNESLNAPGSGYLGDPFKGMSALEVNNMYGDQMQNVRRSNYEVFNNKALSNATIDRQAAIKEEQNQALAKLTGFDKDFSVFMQNHNRQLIYTDYENALTNSEITDRDKALVISALNKNKPQEALNVLLNKTYYGEDKSTFGDVLNSAVGYGHYGQMLQQGTFKQGKPTQEVGLGTKIWDVVTNPGDALYYAMNGRGDSMWDNWAVSYNDRKEAERIYGTDLGTYKDIGPMTTVLDMANTLNPLNWTDELGRSYQANGLRGLSSRSSQLGTDAIETAAMFIPGGQGVKLLRQLSALKRATNAGSALNKFARGYNSLQRGVNSMGLPGRYLVNYATKSLPLYTWDAIRPYGLIHQGAQDIGEGNYLSGTGKLLEGALYGVPAFSRGTRLLNSKLPRVQYQTPSGRTFGIGTARQVVPEGLNYATSQKSFDKIIASNPELKKEYLELTKELHPDKLMGLGKSSEEVLSGQKIFQDLGNLGQNYKEIPFGLNNQLGRFAPARSYNLGRFGQLNVGNNVFQPTTLRQMLMGPQAQPPVNIRGLFGYQNGGSTSGSIINSLRQLGNKFEYGGSSSGLATQLSDSEIDMYVKGGYIIEDE